jgi:hypothetical protein
MALQSTKARQQLRSPKDERSGSSSSSTTPRFKPQWIVLLVLAMSLIGAQFGLFSKFASLYGGTNTSLISGCDQNNNHNDNQGNDNEDDFAVARHESLGFFTDIPSRDWAMLKQRVKDVGPNVDGGDPDKLRRMPRIKPQDFYSDNYEPNFTCRQERRMGLLGGGKWICDPHRIASSSSTTTPCLVYSIGSNGDTSFESTVKKEIGSHCEIHTFDMGDYEEPVQAVGAIYHRWGISGKEFTDARGQKFKSLEQTVQELGHTGRTIDLFKIDCEGCEWSSYNAFFEGGITLRQILVEVHGGFSSATMPMPQAVDFFESLKDQGYVIFHKEPNIHWTHCIEYSFLKLHPDFFV